jgi:hypothetical protein
MRLAVVPVTVFLPAPLIEEIGAEGPQANRVKLKKHRPA